MNNISTGFGLCVLGLGVALWPIMDRFAPSATAAHAGAPVAALTAVVMGQATPTIVWYGTAAVHYQDGQNVKFIVTQVTRAWSDGRVETKFVRKVLATPPYNDPFCDDYLNCNTPWILISDPNTGYSAASDSNFDTKVDGVDLALLLGSWGDAPRHDIPPSDCPLNLINP